MYAYELRPSHFRNIKNKLATIMATFIICECIQRVLFISLII